MPKKDPNAPKRPLSGYMRYGSKIRGEIKDENPDMKMTEVASEIGRRWGELSDAEKKPYNDAYQKEKVKYDAALKKYKEEKGSDDDDDDDDGKKRKGGRSKKGAKRAKKDPNAPKRPLTGFMRYGNEIRGEIKEENPDMKITEIASEIGRRWGELSDAEKKPYNDAYQKEKVKYEAALKKYNSSKKTSDDDDDDDEDDDDDDQ